MLIYFIVLSDLCKNDLIYMLIAWIILYSVAICVVLMDPS